MRTTRRDFVSMLTAATIGATPLASALGTDNRSHIRAVAFDAFVIFDPGPIVETAEELFPGRGKELASLWHTRQFEYTWLRTIGNRYSGFWQVTEDALKSAAFDLRISPTRAQHDRLMGTYENLPAWPDAKEALDELRRRNIRLGLLSNFSGAMMKSNLRAAGLEQYFELQLTTDLVKAFKPSPVAYQMGPDHFGLELSEIAFAAFGSWDAAGAKWFGYRTLWMNRTHVSSDELGIQPDATVSNFEGMLGYLDRWS